MKRAITRVTTALLGVVLFSSIAWSAEPYRVGYNNWIGYVALFVAQEKGYFAEEGIDLQLSSFSAPGEGLKPLLNGDLDAHMTTADSVIIALDKAPGQLKIVYLTDTSSGADAIVARKGIAKVEDLKGKTVAATVGECNELLLSLALEKSGMTEADVNLTNMNPDDAGAAFAAGKLDAAVTWEPWITQVAAEEKGHVIFSSADVPNLILDVVAISTKTAKQKPELTRKFIRALNKANELAMKDPAQASKLAAKALEMKPAEIAEMLPKVTLYGAAENKKQMSGAAREPSAQIAEFFHAKGVNGSVVEVDGIYDASWLD